MRFRIVQRVIADEHTTDVVEADYHTSDSLGVLLFYKIREPHPVASFAPGRWVSVLPEESSE